MAERKIKNDTDQDIEVSDLGIVITAGEIIDLGLTQSMNDLAISDEMIARLGNGDFKLCNTSDTDFHSSAQAIRIISNIPQLSPIDEEGRQFVRAASKPLGCTTYFTNKGDNPTFGKGTCICWDAEDVNEPWQYNADDDEIPVGYKRKRCMINFADSIWVKEGSLYHMNAKKGSYLKMGAMCPPTGVFKYLDNYYVNMTGNYLKIDQFVNGQPMMGDVPMGDEMNTETCSGEIPSFITIFVEFYLIESDTDSYGSVILEIYRRRTVDLDDLVTSGGIVLYTP